LLFSSNGDGIDCVSKVAVTSNPVSTEIGDHSQVFHSTYKFISFSGQKTQK